VAASPSKKEHERQKSKVKSKVKGKGKGKRWARGHESKIDVEDKKERGVGKKQKNRRNGGKKDTGTTC